MPRYYFHVYDGTLSLDRQGTVLPDIRSARREATRFAAGLLSEDKSGLWDGSEWIIQVVSEAKMTVAELRFTGTSRSPVNDGQD